MQRLPEFKNRSFCGGGVSNNIPVPVTQAGTQAFSARPFASSQRAWGGSLRQWEGDFFSLKEPSKQTRSITRRVRPSSEATTTDQPKQLRLSYTAYSRGGREREGKREREREVVKSSRSGPLQCSARPLAQGSPGTAASAKSAGSWESRQNLQRTEIHWGCNVAARSST